MRLDRASTLAHYLDIPHRKAIAFGKQVSAAQIRPAVKQTHSALGGNNMAFPDWEAIEFYALNQLAAVLQARFGLYDDLPPWALSVAEAYTTCLCSQNLRLMHYTLLIITRESRHLHGKGTFWSGVGKAMQSVFREFINSLPSSSDGAVNHFLASAPDMDLGIYCENIATVFHKGNFGGGYGGPPWGNIADTLASYVNGKTSAEIFLDTAYTLAHNNGPIFNKGMYYHGYSNALKQVLDVQRSGQVCEVLLDDTFADAYKHTPLKSRVGKLKHMVKETRQALQALGDTTSIGQYCDWFKVEELGSLQKYPQFKQQQVAAHGKPNAKPPAPAAPPKPAAPPPPAVFNGKPATYVGELFVLPNISAKVYERISK